jgi:hypothetical protein
MTNPLPYLVRMLLFLAAVAGLAYYLHEPLLRVFRNTPDLDAVILGVLAIGIFFVFRQVILLWPEVRWLRRFQHREENSPAPPADSVNLLAPLAAMLGERQDQFRLSPTATRALLDGIASRLDERRELARYMIGLLIFLGLLGTFWGLLQTIGAVADAIASLQVAAGDTVQMFSKLKNSIEGPLKGMSTAFGASLFGLSGSLVLGFLELQASQAQGRFHSELEEWLARATSLSGPALPPEAPASVPAYIEALLERSAEGLDALTRTTQRIEEGRLSATAGNATLIERLAALAESMRAQQNLLARFTELSIDMRGAIGRLADRSGDEADREAEAAHRRNVETLLNRLVEEDARTRAAIADELRGVFGRISDRAADETDREAVLARQREIEAQVARVAEEGARGRSELVDELRGLATRVADRTAADADREALLAQQRAIEERIGKIAEELHGAAQQQSLESQIARLGEELKSVAGRLADRSAADADRDALLARQGQLESQLANLAADTARGRKELADELRDAINRLAERATTDADRENLLMHQRNVEAFLTRLSEENARNRSQLVDELSGAIGRLPDRAMAEADRESLSSHQRNIESHLERLVDENARNRAALVEELREAIGKLSNRFAEHDRDAVAVHQRSIEAQLGRLAENSAMDRAALADELRGEIRLLARTLSISHKEER